MSSARINLPQPAVAEFCKGHGIRRLSLFGSVLREDFRPDSDVDVLVEFLPETRIGMIGMAAMQRELSELIGRQVDLRTPGDLSRYFRAKVIQGAIELYAA
ncbi:MAG: nucleotidyltransferase family protein [Phycisphaerae bacterium]|nr:nucleotidyltransferase family protein [Phycisphaerae bacterium]